MQCRCQGGQSADTPRPRVDHGSGLSLTGGAQGCTRPRRMRRCKVTIMQQLDLSKASDKHNRLLAACSDLLDNYSQVYMIHDYKQLNDTI